MTKKEEKVWAYLVANRKAKLQEVAEACNVELEFVCKLVDRIGTPDWREESFDPYALVDAPMPTPKEKIQMSRADVLDTAKDYVTRDRAADHGDMEDNFRTIASYWNTHLGIDFIRPQDVAVMMTMLKLARIRQNEWHLDNWIDACGYMACGGEIVSKP